MIEERYHYGFPPATPMDWDWPLWLQSVTDKSEMVRDPDVFSIRSAGDMMRIGNTGKEDDIAGVAERRLKRFGVADVTRMGCDEILVGGKKFKVVREGDEL